MNWDISFTGTEQQFSGPCGWVHVLVPRKDASVLRERRRSWGMFPITVLVGKTSWKTKLMMKKGGDFFVALRVAARKREGIAVGDRVTISFKLE